MPNPRSTSWMGRFLVGHLALTGCGATIVMGVPSLIVIGFVAFVIPGLILYFLPTLFLWSVIFALGWWGLRRYAGDVAAAGIAAASTAAFVIAVPLTIEAMTFEMEERPTLEPASPVVLSGDVRVGRLIAPWDQRPEARLGHVRPYNCDALCMALLFAPEVDSVTVDVTRSEPFSASARTFRLLPVDDCEGRLTVEPKFLSMQPLFGAGREERDRLFGTWRARLRDEVCVVSEEPLETHDFYIRAESKRLLGTSKPRWSLFPARDWLRTLEIRDGAGVPLAHQADVTMTVLATPLMLGINGNLTTEPFGWQRARRYNEDFEALPVDIEEGVVHWTTLPETISAR